MLEAPRIGDVKICILNGMDGKMKLMLKNVLYVLKVTFTLVSIGALAQSSYLFSFSGDSCEIKGSDGQLCRYVPQAADGLYKIGHCTEAHAANGKMSIIEAHC